MKQATNQIAVLASVVIVLSGCAAATTTPSRALEGTVWQVEDIDGGGIVDRSMITLDFSEPRRIAGSTGCNRYFGDATVTGAVLSLGRMGSTMRACAPALMNQEQRFLNALNDAARFAIDNDTWLVVYDAEGLERLRAIEVDADPTAKRPQPQDLGSDTPILFDCEAKGAISFHFVGPDTIELTTGELTRVLTREPTASGARYAGDALEFWNKGDEALFTIGKERFTCKRR
jgi:heat shock protein HslJ/membrane-bound inhibitor of C-type lysozyme